MPYATRALDAVSQGRTNLARLSDEAGRRGEAGELVVGVSPAISTYVLPTALRAFRESTPGVELRVRTGHSEDVF